MEQIKNQIKAIIGLGNPTDKHYYQRHNIGFRILDRLADIYSGVWQEKNEQISATITINDQKIILIKPTTYMNNSGRVIPTLAKQGIKAENIVVVHDELELPFGSVKLKTGGSHKGHNGLRSIIGACGPDFMRVRCGIGRPLQRENVPDYVLQPFCEPDAAVDALINQATNFILSLI